MPARKPRSAQGYGYCRKCGAELTPENATPSVVSFGYGLCRKCMKAYCQDNKRRRVIIQAHYYQTHKEEKAVYGVRYRQEHKEEIAAWQSRYRQARAELYVQASSHRRARKQRAAGDSSGAQRRARAEMYGSLCYLCGRLAEAMDHVIPLARGGSNWPANLRPICKSCNSMKGAKWPYDIEAHRRRMGYSKKPLCVKKSLMAF